MIMTETYYDVYLSNRKEPLFLTQAEAEKLMMALTTGRRPQFVLTLEDEMINTSYIQLLLREKIMEETLN